MKCERCSKDEAQVRLTRIEHGQVYQICLCQNCAAEASPYQKKLGGIKKSAVDMILQELMKGQKVQVSVEGAAKRVEVPPCPNCGLEFAAYQSTYMLGCPHCYEAFETQLENDLRKFHRATRHSGNAPEHAHELADRQQRLEEMREELQNAIDYEDFERAAFLRDEISRMEGKNPPGSKPKS